MASSIGPPSLDHIIILIPYHRLLDLDSWLHSKFTLTPGGRHSDSKTENKLVCFADGSYIEFIAFINDDPKLKAGHKWGQCKYGIIDFALTHSDTSAEANWSTINSRLSASGSKARYNKPLAGGRIRDDGEEVKWTVTTPEQEGTDVNLGELPFFCHDVTDRVLRVPDAKERTTHPNKIYGVVSLELYVENTRVRPLKQAYPEILGTEVDEKGIGFEIGRLRKVEGIEEGAMLNIQVPTEKDQIERVRNAGGVLLAALVVGGMSGGKGGQVRVDEPGWWERFLEADLPAI